MIPSPLQSRYAALPLAPLDGGTLPARFGEVQGEIDAMRHGCAVIDLSPLGVVRLTGADTRRFANAQLSHNIRDLPVGGGRHCVITDRKGRIEGMVDAFLVEEREMVMLSAGSDAAWIIERLDSFIIMDPLELEDLSDALAVLSLQGPNAEAALRAIGGTVPERDIARWEAGYVARNDRCAAGGFDLVVPSGRWTALWDAAEEAGARPAGLEALEAARVLRGLPRWPNDMGERAFIHEMRLRDRVAAFDKGCYIGQEVINRMETMGKVNRHLMGLKIDGPGAVGAAVHLDDGPIGVVSTLAHADGHTLALAVLRTAAQPGQSVTLHQGDDAWRAEVCALPFDQ